MPSSYTILLMVKSSTMVIETGFGDVLDRAATQAINLLAQCLAMWVVLLRKYQRELRLISLQAWQLLYRPQFCRYEPPVGHWAELSYLSPE